MWFSIGAACLDSLRDRLRIEACVGDITTVLEEIRHGVVGHRRPVNNDEASQTAAQVHTSDPKVSASSLQDIDDYPKAYDRIHLSNIPDYIGGTLSSYLYALPLTYPGKSSYITSTCLRNPPRFRTIASFDNEYTALHDPSDLAKVFQVKLAENKDANKNMPACGYNIWEHQTCSKALTDLMPRDRLETWLHRLFLKIAIPKDKQAVIDTVLIYSPLNLTAFLRLLVHLYEASYPAHWLSHFWTEILSGTPTSSARPPRTELLALKESKSNLSVKEQSLVPVRAQLTTLTALWRPVLPFGIASPHIPKIETIHKYTVKFQDISDHAANVPTFILAFCDLELLPLGARSIRKYVLSDELADKFSEARRLHKKGLHIISAWDYDRPSKTATFWLRHNVMDAMKRVSGARHPAPASQWAVAVWRTDNWERQAQWVLVDRVRDQGVWIRDGNLTPPETSQKDEGGEDAGTGASENDESDDDDDGEWTDEDDDYYGS
jgi:hypothetical protein